MKLTVGKMYKVKYEGLAIPKGTVLILGKKERDGFYSSKCSVDNYKDVGRKINPYYLEEITPLDKLL